MAAHGKDGAQARGQRSTLMAGQTVQINRAPVLTLWAAVVAERMGFNEAEALSLGKCLAGLNAQAKGRCLGVYKPAAEGAKKARQARRGDEFWIGLCGRPIPAANTDEGVRAVTGDRPIDPEGARRYLEGKFGDSLAAAKKAMETLAAAFEPEELEQNAFALYEQFRPAIPGGVRGWGAKGALDLDFIVSLAGR
jgi:hypothetical protein